jgi:hypothetical protein
LYRFRHLVAQARTADDLEQAGRLFREALDQWRGNVMAGVITTESLQRLCAGIEEERLAALRECLAADLRVGRHTVVLGELAELIAEHPLHESFGELWVRALYMCGRQAQALAELQRIRARLLDELGIDLSPPLRALQQQMLTADPVLNAPADRVLVARPTRPVVPQQLPAPPRLFVGRSRELRQLGEVLRPESAVVMSVISGAGGIGKSWLALRWAHGNRDRFPDGQLFVNLRGFDPSGEPLSPKVAVRGFLDALGVDAESVPNGLDLQTALYRSLVAGRRMLIVLDNARDSRHVESLLPGSPLCTVLITSRRHLAGLITAHGAHPMELDVLPDHEAEELFRSHVGSDRTSAEPEAAAEIVASCAGLPLALGVVAVRAGRNPRFPLAALAGELRDSAARLDALDGGDLSANVRAMLSWTYDTVDDDARRLFALLGLTPGPDISLPAVVSLSGWSATRALAVLRDLENAHLVQQPLPGRYRMHDLVWLFAEEQAGISLDRDDRRAALRRLVDFYLQVGLSRGALTGDFSDPARRHVSPARPSRGRPGPRTAKT